MANTDGFTVQVQGIEELERKLQALEMKIDTLLYQATSEAAAVVVREAKVNSQKGGEFPNRITGNLMRSLKPIATLKSADRVEIQVGSSMKYALRLEYGFSDTDSLGRVYHQPAKPFLRTALDENEDKIIGAFEDKIKLVLGGL